MRFMMLMIANGYNEASPDQRPDVESVAAMTRYNETLIKAGVMLSGDGLHPPASGTRFVWGKEGGKPKVVDGPFTEAKEVLGGYWMIQVKSKAEALEWASRIPGKDCTVEVRQVFEMADFPADVQEAARIPGAA